MKKIYFLLIAFLSAGVTFSQQQNQQNTIENYSTATTVDLADFTAKRTTNGIEFSWVATNEINIKSHEIEKSANGSSFTSLGTIVAQNNPSTYKYTYSDGTPVEGFNYYKVRSTAKNGEVAYSRILKIDNSYRKTDFSIIPNPVKNGVLNMQLSNMEAGKYNITLYNSGGIKVFARSFDYTSGSATETVYLPPTLSRGLYFLQLNNGEMMINKQVMIQ